MSNTFWFVFDFHVTLWAGEVTSVGYFRYLKYIKQILKLKRYEI